MFYQIFAQIVNMSMMVSVVIIVVLLARLLMRKLPKKYSYLLWVLVAVRLLCPVGLPSSLSVFNLIGMQELSVFQVQETGTEGLNGKEGEKGAAGAALGAVAGKSADEKSAADKSALDLSVGQSKTGTETIKGDTGKAQSVTAGKTDTKGDSQNTSTDNASVSGKGKTVADKAGSAGALVIKENIRRFAFIWAVGIALILLYHLFCYIRMRKRVERAVLLKENIYECEEIPTPFVMGIFKTRIYLPFRLKEEEQEYIIRHERYHLYRKDYLIKLAAFFLTCVYWFHPLVWVSYFLMIRDMEMSCDEYVLKKSSTEIRAAYCESLLGFAMNQRDIGMGLIAFGESDTRKRVKNIMQLKKYGKWIGALAVCFVLLLGVSCLTNAKKDKQKEEGKTLTLQENERSLVKQEINGYQTELLYVAKDTMKEEPEDGFYRGDFVLRTGKDGKEIDRIPVKIQKDGEMVFPAKGFTLWTEDYDGDGKKNDFSLGQGQSDPPELGNFMNYRLYGIDDDGTVIAYHVVSEMEEEEAKIKDDYTITAIPGEYSKLFEGGKGSVTYLSTNDGESLKASVYRSIPLPETEKKKTEPEYSLMRAIEKNTRPEIVEELKKNGFWHISRSVVNEETYSTYTLTNASGQDGTLEIEIQYDSRGLYMYSCDFRERENKFTDRLPQAENVGDKVSELLTGFTKDFFGVDSTYDTRVDTDAALVLYGFLGSDDRNGNLIFSCDKEHITRQMPEPDEEELLFLDTNGSNYLYNTRLGMIVYYDGRLEEERKEQEKEQAFLKEVREKGEEVLVKKAEYKLSDSTGVDPVEIKYVDSEKLIFSGCFGLFVYDRKEKEFISEVDLHSIGCDATQGDNFAEISVSKDGNTVYLHSMSSKDQYVYDVEKAQMKRVKYEKAVMDEIYLNSTFMDYETIEDSDPVELNYNVAYYMEDGRRKQLCFVSDDLSIGGLGLTGEEAEPYLPESLFLGKKYAEAKLLGKKDLKDIVKVEMFVGGKMHTETSKKKLGKAEKLISASTVIKGGSACPFWTPMYVTTADGTFGVIYPAMDSCDVVVTADGGLDLGIGSTDSGLRGVCGWKTERESERF